MLHICSHRKIYFNKKRCCSHCDEFEARSLAVA